MATAAQLAREGAVNRSGNKLALADDFILLVFYTTILFFFCFSCPLITSYLITPIYGMFLSNAATAGSEGCLTSPVRPRDPAA